MPFVISEIFVLMFLSCRLNPGLQYNKLISCQYYHAPEASIDIFHVYETKIVLKSASSDPRDEVLILKKSNTVRKDHI